LQINRGGAKRQTCRRRRSRHSHLPGAPGLRKRRADDVADFRQPVTERPFMTGASLSTRVARSDQRPWTPPPRPIVYKPPASASM
jgi:hypothetical protein